MADEDIFEMAGEDTSHGDKLVFTLNQKIR